MAITSIKTGSSFKTLTKYDSFLAGNPSYVPPSFESIATVTGTGSSNTITFSSIPQTYSHLQIRCLMRGSYVQSSSGAVWLTANSISGTYTYHYLYGSGSSANAAGAVSQTNGLLGVSANNGSTNANIYGAAIVDIHNYSSTTQNKIIRSFNGEESNGLYSGSLYLISSLIQTTSALTSISIINNDGNWLSGATFALYGIKG
jgi:hypothetical protein